MRRELNARRIIPRAAGRNHGWRIAAVILMLGALLGAVPVMQGQSGAASEYAVKAAFLFHFAQFVEWPAAAFRDASSPLVYCTIGLDPFQGALDAALSGKMIGARAFQVRHYKEAQEAHGCHVLFIGAEQKRQLSAALSELKGTPVLVVGESDKFVDEGGMIGFSLEENKVRFEINLEAAEKAGLKISAKLLALAKTVRGAPKRG